MLKEGFLGFRMSIVKEMIKKLLEALNFIHSNNIVHCDLKPHNILFANSKCESIKLGDFGSAFFNYNNVYTYCGSRFYRSPEIILRYPIYTDRVDIWSLGCIAAELLMGKPLFPGNSDHE